MAVIKNKHLSLNALYGPSSMMRGCFSTEKVEETKGCKVVLLTNCAFNDNLQEKRPLQVNCVVYIQ